MFLLAREDPMKQRQWKTKRQVVERADAQRHWDQAYQCLMRWTSCSPQPRLTELSETREERSDESGSLCSCLGKAGDANPKHRATNCGCTSPHSNAWMGMAR